MYNSKVYITFINLIILYQIISLIDHLLILKLRHFIIIIFCLKLFVYFIFFVIKS